MIVETEVAVEIGDDGRSIVALLPALEIADPPDLDLDVEQILAGNIFHRAVAFGPRVETQEPGAARILVNGEEQHTVPADRTGTHARGDGRGRRARRLDDAARSFGRATASSPAISRRRTRRAPGDTRAARARRAGGRGAPLFVASAA